MAYDDSPILIVVVDKARIWHNRAHLFHQEVALVNVQVVLLEVRVAIEEALWLWQLRVVELGPDLAGRVRR